MIIIKAYFDKITAKKAYLFSVLLGITFFSHTLVDSLPVSQTMPLVGKFIIQNNKVLIVIYDIVL